MQPSLWLGLAVLLLVAGVVGSVTPLVPGPLLSVGGVLLYWWHTGYTDPSAAFVGVVVAVGLLAVLVDWFAGAISAKVGGASTRTTLVAAVVGFLAFFVAGPLGVIAGVAAAAFVIEASVTGDPTRGLEAAVYATVGVVASAAVQVLLTLSILVGFLLAVAAF